MVESGKSTLTEDLQNVLDQALRSGMDAKAITRMVAERALTLNDVARNGLAPKTPPEDAGDVIYEPGELPEGLIDLPSAAKKYGIKADTLRHWVYQGHVPMVARLKGPAAGGGYKVVRLIDLEAHIRSPRKRTGRPKKSRK